MPNLRVRLGRRCMFLIQMERLKVDSSFVEVRAVMDDSLSFEHGDGCGR